MLNAAFFLQILSVILQYGILLILYYFLYRIVRFMYRDLRAAGKAETRSMDTAEAVLTVLDAGDERLRSRRFAFSSAISIGRGSENDVVIEDTYVSHHHAVIEKTNNLYVIEDLKSVNHTYLNDKILLKKTVLRNGDIIKIGLATFKFAR